MTNNNESAQRQAFVEGLRDLAAFLEQHPDVPLHRSTAVEYCALRDNDEAGVAVVAEAAAALGVEMTDSGGKPATADTTHFYAVRRFGPIAYRAFYVSRREMQDHDALMSYSGAIRAQSLK